MELKFSTKNKKGEDVLLDPHQVAAQFGWQIAAIDQLNKRIATLEEISTIMTTPLEMVHLDPETQYKEEELAKVTIKQKLENTKTKVYDLDRIVRKTSMIWISADKEKSQSKKNRVKRAIKGYETLFSEAINDTDIIKQHIQEFTPLEQESMLRCRTRWLNNTYFQAARFLISISFNPEAVIPTLKGTYVFPPSMFMPNDGGLSETITGSGGKTSEDKYREYVRQPPNKKANPRMRNTID